jgi:ABC-type sulfate transport system permease component
MVRYIYGAVWFSAFSYLAYMLYSGSNFHETSDRKARLGGYFFDLLTATLGHAGAAALALVIGAGVAYWASRPDKEGKS